MKKTLSNYPKTRRVTCPLCGVEHVVVREGDGRPWGNGLNYWYKQTHQCEKMKEARKVTEKLNGFFQGR